MLTNMTCLLRWLLISSVVSHAVPCSPWGQIWWQGGLTILYPGPSEQPGPLGTGRSRTLRSLPAQSTVTLWLSDSKAAKACSVSLFWVSCSCHRHLGGLQTELISVQQLTTTTGPSSPPQLTSPFAVLQEIQLGRCFFCGFEYLPLENRACVVAKHRSEHKWDNFCSPLWLILMAALSALFSHSTPSASGLFHLHWTVWDSRDRCLLRSHSLKAVSMRKMAYWKKNKNHWW